MTDYLRPQLAFDGGVDAIDKIPRDGTWVMEPKFDGWRWQLHRTKDGFVSFGGRNGKEHPTPPAIAEALMALKPGTVLDGELIQGRVSTDVAHALAHDEATSFVVFDLLGLPGDAPMVASWSHRRFELEGIVSNTPMVRVSPVSDVDPEMLQHWLDLGVEGAVFKRCAAPYKPGSRSKTGFVKTKTKLTTDAIVTGWNYGKGKDNGHLCSALTVQLIETGMPTTVGYGAWPEDAEKMIGRRVELQHYGFNESGKVRHPGYVRLRPDLETETTEGAAV